MRQLNASRKLFQLNLIKLIFITTGALLLERKESSIMLLKIIKMQSRGTQSILKPIITEHSVGIN